jgi:uncharacterized protein YdaU (DUF1376 family)
MAKPDVWMPLYIGDYLSDTMHLTTEQHGAYLLLIMAYWKNGGALPASDAQLAAICRMPIDAWSNARAVLENFFDVSQEGKWVSKRVEKEMQSAGQKKAQASQKAANAAAARWNKISIDAPSIPQAMPEHMLEECPSPSPSPIEDQDQKHLSPSATREQESDRKIPFDRILGMYQKICGKTFKGAALLTDARKKNITKCWNRKVEGKHVFRSGDFWTDYFTWCLRDAHWCGEPGKTWKATLEFVTRPDIVDRLIDEMTLEGVFANEPA